MDQNIIKLETDVIDALLADLRPIINEYTSKLPVVSEGLSNLIMAEITTIINKYLASQK